MMSLMIKSKPKDDDMRNELKKIKTVCDRHQTLCQSFTKWKQDVAENDAQLEILNNTAASLRSRHRSICEQIKRKPTDVREVERLQREISYIEAEVEVWTKELTEVNEARTDLDIQFIQLRSQLQRSVTNVELANIDFDLLEKHHCAMWKNFLYKSENLS